MKHELVNWILFCFVSEVKIECFFNLIDKTYKKVDEMHFLFCFVSLFLHYVLKSGYFANILKQRVETKWLLMGYG